MAADEDTIDLENESEDELLFFPTSVKRGGFKWGDRA